jgi:hypothetical protein
VKVHVLEVWDAERMWCELWSRGESFTFLTTIGTFIIIPLPLPQSVVSKSRISKPLYEEVANPYNLPSLKKWCPCGNGGV